MGGAAGGKGVALGGRLWTVAAGGWSWLLCMQARYVEQQREQAEDRRDSMQSFLHLYRWTFQSVKVMHSFENFSPGIEDGR